MTDSKTIPNHNDEDGRWCRWSLCLTFSGNCPDHGAIDPECRCDLDSPCTFPPCVAERDAEEARHAQLYAATRPDPTLGTYGEQMVDAGRGHLLRADEL